MVVEWFFLIFVITWTTITELGTTFTSKMPTAYMDISLLNNVCLKEPNLWCSSRHSYIKKYKYLNFIDKNKT